LTLAHLQLIAAAIAVVLALVTPLVLIVRAMTRQQRRAWLTTAPLTGLVVLGALSIGAWLWVSLTDIRISARIHGPVQASLLAFAAIAVYLLWLAVPVAAATWLVFKLPDTASRPPAIRAGFVGVGILAAIGGVYFAFRTAGAIWALLSFIRVMSRQPSVNLLEPGVLIVALVSSTLVIVLGSATGLLLLIAFWGLEPGRRWRQWRPARSELPPS
jgi:hypothetical protein